MKTRPVHPLADLLPPMSEADYAALLADIESNGQRDPVELFQGKIIDGRHRDRAMVQLGRKTKTIVFKGTEAEAFSLVCSRAIRRNMNTSQKVWAAVTCLPHFKAQAAKRKAANGGSRKAEALKLEGPADKQNSVKGDAAHFAGRAFGVSAASVYQGEQIRQADPDEFAKLGTGATTLAKAKRAVHCKVKRKQLNDKAEAIASTSVANVDIVTRDCVKHMRTMPRGKVRLVFADPPYNIDYDYGPGTARDKVSPDEYLALTRSWVEEAHGILSADGTLWVMICDEWAAEYAIILKAAGFTIRRWVKWHETFGANCADNFNRTTRHLFYCVKDPSNFVFNHKVFNRPSDRQTKYKDKRAAAGGKLWNDLWEIPRLVDNCAERVLKGATQLPLALVIPIVEGCSEPGDLVFDPFTGSGTTAEAAVQTGRHFIGTEKTREFAAVARVRVRAAIAKLQPGASE